MNKLQSQIEKIYSENTEVSTLQINDILDEFSNALNEGKIRSASKINGKWQVNIWVKQGILLLFRYGNLIDMSINEQFKFFDKHTIPLRKFTTNDQIRIVPGGSTIRNGSYLAKGVVCMPPMYINIGAYIDEGTMIDSHALVGTCAQIGKRVHISAAAQIGGVLEPVGISPVIIEDDVIVGGNCGIYEGVVVEEKAILSSGVILNASSKVYDIVNEKIIMATDTLPLTIPSGAVVVQGARAVNTAFGVANHLSITTPLIVKYRDHKTNKKTELEDILR